MTITTGPTRRTILQGGVAVAGALAAPSILRAAAYPDRNISVIIPTREGGGADRNFRAFTKVWGPKIGTEFEPGFFPGASGRVGYEVYMGKNAPDAYSLIFGNMGPEVLNWAVAAPQSFAIEDYLYFGRVDTDPGCAFVGAESKFQSIEDINNYLLSHKQVMDYVENRPGKPRIVFLMFDEDTEKLAKEMGAEIWFPKAKLRTRVDNKIETVRIGNKAGVPSVPNTLSVVKDWAHLVKVAEKAGLGGDLVLQSAFGDSGHTTFFIASEADFRKHEHEIVGQGEIKIMKRVDVRGSAIEACSTKQGTIVGPLMTELVGFKDLTPYRGGWCGNEIFSTAFTPEIRNQARDLTFRFGEQLRKEGYRGYFELDFLIDKK
ncbi:MAG: hypothetical protein AAFZ09_07425, partial [Pseudomonadota bacterium]